MPGNHKWSSAIAFSSRSQHRQGFRHHAASGMAALVRLCQVATGAAFAAGAQTPLSIASEYNSSWTADLRHRLQSPSLAGKRMWAVTVLAPHDFLEWLSDAGPAGAGYAHVLLRIKAQIPWAQARDLGPSQCPSDTIASGP